MSLLLLLACGDAITGQDKGPDDGNPDSGTLPPTLSLAVAEVDFGELAYNELDQTLLSLSNVGDEVLELSTITVASPFRSSPESLTVQPGNTAQITLTVQLSDYEDHREDLLLTSNDPAAPELAVPLHAALIRDADGDGYETDQAEGGTDCDDGSDRVHPDAEETWYDGRDQDCDGANDFDQDLDGYEAETDDHHPEQPDCNDSSADTHPGAADSWYDGRDTDCDDRDDYDQDGDGAGVEGHGDDCDDLDASVGPDAVEAFDGIDNDCDSRVDDETAFASAAYRYQAKGNYDQAGSATAWADLDGDGDDELVVGAPFVGAGGPSDTGKGAVAIFSGGEPAATGTSVEDAFAFAEGAIADEGWGARIAPVGDWDGDGVPDLAIQAQGFDEGAGAVMLMSGEALLAGADDGEALYQVDGGARDALGGRLAVGLDLDGDGLGDLLAASGEEEQSLVLVYGGASGSASVEEADARWSTGGSSLGEGDPVAADLDGDGYLDLALGDASLTVDGVSGAGAVWALAGGPSRLDSAADATVDSEDWVTIFAGSSPSDGVGAAVQTGEDWDEDGDAELWIQDRDDALYVIAGGPDRFAATADPGEAFLAAWTWGGGADDVRSLHRVGDWDGDGLGDIGAFTDVLAGELAFYGSAALGLHEAEEHFGHIAGSTGEANSLAGRGTAATPGDADGDGDADLLSADPGFDGNAGEIYLFLQR